jgi:diguanylate cyclase (GGDEF)-like protein
VTAVALALCFASTCSAQLPTLTTAKAAHSMSIQESARSYPVRLRAVVVYYDPYIDSRHPALFVHDSTGGVFVALSSVPAMPLETGDLIEVTGVSGPGDFAPIVDRARARFIRKSHVPPDAEKVSLTEMLSGQKDCHWVEVQGVVRSIGNPGKNVFLDVALSDGNLAAGTVRETGFDYAFLVDAEVKIRGVVAPTFNHQRQMTGAHLLFPDLRSITVVAPGPERPFDSAVASIGGLLRFTANAACRHRVRIRGTVTLFWPGRMLCAQTDQITPVNPGELVDMIGFPEVGEFAPTLASAIYRRASGGHALTPLQVTASQALSGDHDATLVQIDGVFIGEDQAAKDPTIILASGKSIFSVIRPDDAPLQDWEEGSTLRIAGICLVHAIGGISTRGAGFSRPESFRIMLQSASDVAVTRRRSWWTAAHALWVLALALAGLVLAAAALFEQVRQGRRTASKLTYALNQMYYQAHHDPLTGLANRLMFNETMSEALIAAEKTCTSVALLYLDLDRFKAINDSLGHAAGDMLLKQAAERLTSVSPPGSVLSRLGGDEFALLLTDIYLISQAETVARKVIDVMAVPFQVDGVSWHCPSSIGVSLFPQDAQNALALQRNADTALYRAKRNSPGQFVSFDQSMSEQAERSVSIEKALRHAVERGSFWLAYQPQFAANGNLQGFEALLRLSDEVLGPISPGEFIPVAEELGLISKMGEWALREACRQMVAWGYKRSPAVSMAVNVSPSQLKRGDFPRLVKSVLAETGLPPRLLELELTETSVFSHAHDSLLELKALGIRIAVDDFGTGFSSLGSLHRAPVDCVKIDRSFVRDAASSPGTLPFVRTIVSLARSLGMTTVAEGVETPSQLEAVRSAGCDVLQGFLLSYPLTATRAGLLLRNHPCKSQDEFDSEFLVGAGPIIR